MKRVGEVKEFPYQAGEEIPTVKQEKAVIPLPVSTDPELPSEIDGAARADMIVREQDLTPGGTPIDVPSEITGLVPSQPKQPGIGVDPVPSDRELIVRFKGSQVCWLKYLPGPGLFVIKRRIELDGGNQQVTQYKDRLAEAWRVAAIYGVTPAEFQKAFQDLPPEVNWTFDCCPWGRLDCDLSYAKVDIQQTRINPDLLCRKCGCRFASDRMGDVTLKDPGKDPDGKLEHPVKVAKKSEPFIPHEVEIRGEIREVPAVQQKKKAVTFAEDAGRYRGMGPSKVEKLHQAGFNSWADLANPEKRDALFRIGGISTNLANFLIEIAEEKV